MKALILVVALAMMWQSQIAAATTPSAVLYVRTDGFDGPGCGTSITSPCRGIATAVSHANDYATTTIKVAQGDYSEWINIDYQLPASGTGTLAIEGGWNSEFTTQSPDPTKTRITSSNINNPLINITAGTWEKIDLRLSYLTLHGTTDDHRKGVAANALSQSTINLDIEHCRIVSFRGQGLSLYADSVSGTTSKMTATVNDTTFQGNYQYPSSSPWPGAGISVTSFGGGQIDINLTKNTINANQASAGGGIYLYTRAKLNATLVNNILAENFAGGDGGALSTGAAGTGEMNLTLINNTISKNHSEVHADGISFAAWDTAKLTALLTNTIISNDTIDIAIDRYNSSTIEVKTKYSIFSVVDNSGGTLTESSNLKVDPLLDSHYHLTGASPAKEKGICGITAPVQYFRIAPDDDIDGDARPGWDVELGCDIGADEYRFPWILFNPVITKQH